MQTFGTRSSRAVGPDRNVRLRQCWFCQGSRQPQMAVVSEARRRALTRLRGCPARSRSGDGGAVGGGRRGRAGCGGGGGGGRFGGRPGRGGNRGGVGGARSPARGGTRPLGPGGAAPAPCSR